MSQCPAPVVENHLILVATSLLHALSPRRSFITYACSDSTGGSTPQVIANLLENRFVTAWQAQLDTNVTIGPTSIRIGNGTDVQAVAVSNVANVAGTRALSSPPPNNNMLIKKLTGASGKRNRGRFYLPWSIDEAGVDEVGILTSGEVSGAQTRATAWLTGLTTDQTPMVVAQRFLVPNPSPPPDECVDHIDASSVVTQLVVESLIGSQRRRIGR